MDLERLQAEGWQRVEVGGFSGVICPFWVHRDDGLTIGFLSEQRHANNHMGTVHGGVLMTFADVALGYGAVEQLGGAYCATVQLQAHMVATPKVGEFISCRPEVIRRTRAMLFMRGLILADDRTVASVDGIWKILEPRDK